MADFNERVTWNISHHGMNYNFTRFDYSFKFSTSIRIQDINEDFFWMQKREPKNIYSWSLIML
jgi:hypothetical protein